MREKPEFKVGQVIALDSGNSADTYYFRIKERAFATTFYPRWAYLDINGDRKIWWQGWLLRALTEREERLAEIFKKK